MTNPKQLLAQRELYEDYLAPFEDLILAASDDFIEVQVLIWAIVHYVPLQYLCQNGIYILFYENLVDEPEKELSSLFQYLYGEDDLLSDDRLLKKIHKPARTIGKNKERFSEKNIINPWIDELSHQQIDRGMKILNCFGLDRLYGEDSMPHKDFVLSPAASGLIYSNGSFEKS